MNTSQSDIRAEIERQGDRLALCTDPVNKAILRTSILDLIDLYKMYPLTIWAQGPHA